MMFVCSYFLKPLFIIDDQVFIFLRNYSDFCVFIFMMSVFIIRNQLS
jgi:hypothetical protein